MNKQTLTQIGKSVWKKQDAVTSIEYALIASLIMVVIIGAVVLVGTRTFVLWSLIANCANSATTGVGSCS